jgi:CTP synthase
MQMAVIEYARNVLQLSKANSVEMDTNTPHPVISLMDEQRNIAQKGGTMRLGAWTCAIEKDTLLQKVYKSDLIKERHRHRYEFNDAYYEQFKKHGMIASGVNPETKLVEAIELPEHPWFVGVQYHPEYSSTVANPHPLFVDFVNACNSYAQSKK